ncbi:Metallo-dependent phosphatase [Anaeromyces robustus]|uniref:Metallo-dependent phosphatase n=1 Tax=Anaeromyces robustus TaxID=1754192 RepID=A0A1Y1X5S7_9FUNG|nr:Metallo-dependent phosphatase [Anaeromyces robustus]|eukprot:ORX81005.1 Metallo-dependent phosphatase [Anaeromyces robustus]
MKKFILFITLFGYLFIQSFGKNPDKDIVILYTNDVHCAIDNDETTIGYPGLVSYRDEIVKKGKYVALVDAGDHVQGAAIGSISKGDYIIDIMNEVNYDAVVPGNHEFDYGMEQFLHFTETLDTGYISCNFRDLKTGKLVLKPYKIKEYGDVKVAFIGIATPESITKSVPGYFMDSNNKYIYDFDGDEEGVQFYALIQQAINDAKNEGADFIVGVGHLGESADITPAWSAQSVVANTSGIDVFIDGHSHQVQEGLKQKNLDGKEILITQSGSQFKYIGKVTISTKGKISTELIDRSKVSSANKNLQDFINAIKNKFENALKEVLNHVSFRLNINDENGSRIIRKQETNLSNLVSDAILNESKKYADNVDFSFVNGGNIRTFIDPGDITVGNIRDVLPFNNELCIIEVSGQTILDALELSSSKYPSDFGGFLHPSGLTYAINPDIETSVVTDEKNIFTSVSGDRRIHSVLVNGKAIDPKKKYTVTGDNYFLIQGGDGYVFNDATIIIKNFGLPSDVVGEYIKKLSEEEMNKYKEPQGRIVFSNVTIIDDNKLNKEGESGANSLIINTKLSIIIFMATLIFYCIM